ncbi:HPr family phosphocarrier protein [Arthrobacter psychrolactophilus]|uniref:Phosphocarrier protein HPr n=1 Tax=Arthrobacter psychrolactophilus TaxID=92442 RepID=A0A2V5ITJ7_9MICC|nr:HPr family phosphocarrier protein [Arthrobacter psychrolactophilus]PYI37473.1 HPr family phosphocarrier protein [Arthrobacter psychrolactophilus]
MTKQTVVVGSSVGLHARPAAMIAQAAGAYEEEILLILDGEEVDATSSLMIMTLGADCGASVTVESENADAVAEIAGLIARDLDA